MASADPQRQQHAQGKSRASFILRGRPRGPGVPGGRTVRGAPAAGPDPRPPPGAELASRRASRARVRARKVWGAPTPLQGRLFKFGEVGSAPSKGAWGFVINPRQSGAKEAAAAAELEYELCWGVPQAACPESQTLLLGSPHTHSFEPSQSNPLRVRECLWSPLLRAWQIHLAKLFHPHNIALY